MDIKNLQENAIELLKHLIETPSFSGEEDNTALLIYSFLEKFGVQDINRHLNNIWAKNKHFDPLKPTILLNSHHDTVRPNKGYTKDPFSAIVEGDILYGLGSNDAGASAVSLLSTFVYYYEKEDLKYNLLVAITGEEESSGDDGIRSILDKIKPIDFAIVGEPTMLQMAVAEKGLMVLDCTAIGKAGHAAREEGDNAIYKAMKDIAWFENYRFDKISDTLGPVKMTVTQINAGKQHNVVPAHCDFVVDVRPTDKYSNQEILDIIEKNTVSEIKPRKGKYSPSFIGLDHPIVLSGKSMGISHYGSPTLSDQAMLSCPSLKFGPGDSARSHTADEYIKLSEVRSGVETYIELLRGVL